MKKIFALDTLTDNKEASLLLNLNEILGEKLDEFEVEVVHLATEGFDKKKLLESDKVIMSGSVKAAYEDFAWKKQMHEIMDIVLGKDIPTLATCFAAQFLAFHLGVPVARNPKGPEFGMVEIELTEEGKKHPFLTGFDKAGKVFATHGDYIPEVPKGASLLASNSNTLVQAYEFGNVFATQFHSDISLREARYLFINKEEQKLFKNEEEARKIEDGLKQIGEAHMILRRFLGLL